jgi:hypothetical protein
MNYAFTMPRFAHGLTGIQCKDGKFWEEVPTASLRKE